MRPFGCAAPMAAPNHVDYQPQAAASVAAVSATAGHCCQGVVAPDGDDLTLTLAKAFANTTLETVAAAAAVADKQAAPGVSGSPPVRGHASQQDTPAAAVAAAKPAGGRAELRARRRMRLRLIRVPTDYLRAGQESRDRSRRRKLVRRCVAKLFFVHEDRARERGISAMMARLTAGGEGDAAVSAAAAPLPEHAGLADLLEKMALSMKH